MESAVAKTVAAFLNSDGGTLLVKVNDGHDIVGIEPDLALFRGSRDKYCNWLTGSLLGELCGRDVVAERVGVELVDVGSHCVAAVEVEAHNEPTWVRTGHEETFYVRSGNRTQELAAKQMVNYINAHWI